MTSALDLPKENTRGDLVLGTNRSRLALAMEAASRPEDPYTFQASPQSLGRFAGGGVDNPFGSGIRAYEPNTEIFSGYEDAYAAVQNSRAREAATANSTTTLPGPVANATGRVRDFIQAAYTAAQNRVPYVWGGTNLASGVDCSGLIMAAAQAAGIQLNGKAWPRYRAVDYGSMGQRVAANGQGIEAARPGDIVYYDEPGDTDHVGIYIGNGQMIQAPTTGQTVKISPVGRFTSIQRIFGDDLFGTIATPMGGTATSYNGQPYNPGSNIGSTTVVRTRGTGGTMKAI